MMTTRNTVASLALLASALSAQAAISEIQWSEAGTHQQRLEIPAGKLAEVCGKLAKGQTVAWSFKSDAALNFNIHYHAGKQVFYPVQRTALSQADGELRVELDQDYCWMWSNKGSAPALLQIELRR